MYWRDIGTLFQSYLRDIGELFESYLRVVGELFERYWKVIWKLLERYWRLIWELFESYLGVIRELFERCCHVPTSETADLFVAAPSILANTLLSPGSGSDCEKLWPRCDNSPSDCCCWLKNWAGSCLPELAMTRAVWHVQLQVCRLEMNQRCAAQACDNFQWEVHTTSHVHKVACETFMFINHTTSFLIASIFSQSF